MAWSQALQRNGDDPNPTQSHLRVGGAAGNKGYAMPIMLTVLSGTVGQSDNESQGTFLGKTHV